MTTPQAIYTYYSSEMWTLCRCAFCWGGVVLQAARISSDPRNMPSRTYPIYSPCSWNMAGLYRNVSCAFGNYRTRCGSSTCMPPLVFLMRLTARLDIAPSSDPSMSSSSMVAVTQSVPRLFYA
ncbi:hypothetical protein IG631_13743 [Alternaria alternata]|nr:hypothetical protein IG631_13743 [Alternaria alternata]